MESPTRLPNGRFPKGNGAHPSASYGAGWGGPAKGPGNGSERHVLNGPVPPKYSIDGESRLERQARHAELMREKLFEKALTAERDEAQIAAAEKYLNRLEGLPVQRVVSQMADPVSRMSDQELQLEIERQRQLVATLEKLEALPPGRPDEDYADSRTETPNDSG